MKLSSKGGRGEKTWLKYGHQLFTGVAISAMGSHERSRNDVSAVPPCRGGKEKKRPVATTEMRREWAAACTKKMRHAFFIVTGRWREILSRRKSFARFSNADGTHFINVSEHQHESDLPLLGAFGLKLNEGLDSYLCQNLISKKK